ncbi:MAG: hypothetical protein ACOCRX_06555 [Candidatus Woesearchaeota archaeon]
MIRIDIINKNNFVNDKVNNKVNSDMDYEEDMKNLLIMTTLT